MLPDIAECRPCALVTRPRAEADGLVRSLAARGIGAVLEPLLDITYRDTAVDLTGVQALLCTSANGVRALARASNERSLALLAVGDATAARARAAGFAQVESAGGAIGELAALAAARLRPETGRLVHVAGSEVAGDLAGILRTRGFAVDRLVLYDARPVERLAPTTVRALDEGAIAFALFFSPRTAAVFARLVMDAGVAGKLGMTDAVSISAAADAAIAGLAWRERRVAAKPTQAALLTVLDQLLAQPLQQTAITPLL